MTDIYLMGLDVGGGGGRCLLVNTRTGTTVSAFRSWTHPAAPEAGSFAFNLDTDNIWRVLCETARDAIQKADIPPEAVAGIAATSMRHGMVAIDKKGQVLLAGPNMDARAVEQGMGLAMERGEELYKITGHAPSPILMAARLMWIKEKAPESFKSVFAALSISDWVGYMLTGEAAAEPAQAAESLLFDLQSRKWSGEVIKSLGLSEKILPPLKNAGTKLGKLTREAADGLGLPAGLPVAVGGPDTQCGLLGEGVVAPGQIGVVAGTTTPIQMVIEKPVIDTEMRTWTGLHVVPGLYVLESNAGQMGSTLDWIAHVIHGEAPNPVGIFAAGAESSSAGAHGIHSTIGAAVFNASALEPPVDNLTFSSVLTRPGEEGRADLSRAVLEGMAYAVRANVEQILEISGGNAGDLWVGGGITRSSLWTRIISEVMGCPVHVCATAESTALGAALCAGVAAGLYPDLPKAAQALARTCRDHQPGEDSATYQALYADWQSLRQERRPADMVAASQVTSVMMSGPSAVESSAASASFRPKIYISAEVDENALQKLREIGEVKYAPYRLEGILLTGDDLVQTLKGYQVFVTEVDIVDAECLLKLPDLRMVVVCRGNPVNIDIPACTAASIPVTNTPARNADAVADLAVSFLLMLARRLQGAVSFLHQVGGEAGDLGRMGQAHEEFLGVELWRKTIGVVGGGAIGRKVIQRLLPFGARLLLFDPYLSGEQATLMGAEKVSFERLLTESDFISLHAPVTDETRNMVDDHAFELMKPGAFLVNSARAALVDQEALLAALHSEKLGGYATDVFPVEPPGADDPLLAFPNVIATPHVGGDTLEVAAHQGEIIASELKLLLAGKRPKYILNAPTLESFNWTGERKTDESALRERIAAPGPGTTDLEVAAQKKEPEEKTTSLPASSAQGVVLNGKVDASMSTNATREKMVQILKEFTTGIAADKEMSNFAKGKNVVFTFTVKDIDETFFMSFLNGEASAGLEAPPREPDVKLKMSADILDGMFTGRVNATKAATSGKLSFSGDTGKAMSFIRIQGSMGRLYSEARQKIGDPGDLTQLSAAPASTPVPAATQSILTPVPAAPAAAAPTTAASSAGREKMIRILQEFTAQITTDKAMTHFAKGKNVVFSFTIKDLDKAFFMSFVDGKVGAGLDTPPRDPDVKLKMSADTLDGMFTGRINATKAATSGKLSFSGDTGKAMAFIRIQGDMGRLYSDARQKIGDPGDLTAIGAPALAAVTPAAPAAPGAMPVPAAAAYMPAEPAVVRKGDVRDEILQITSELYANGLITATGGNVSARCDDNPNEIWITPSAIFKGDLRPEMMVRINLEGKVVSDTDYPASSERRVHCAIYRDQPDITAVIHSHAPEATLMAITGTKFQPISADAAFFGDIPVVSFIMPGTDELGEEVAKAMLINGIAVLMQNHGLVVSGSSLRRAADMTYIIEVTAQKLLSCRMMGVEPALLPEDIVKTLKELGASMA